MRIVSGCRGDPVSDDAVVEYVPSAQSRELTRIAVTFVVTVRLTEPAGAAAPAPRGGRPERENLAVTCRHSLHPSFCAGRRAGFRVSIDGVSALGVDGEALKRLSDLFGLDQADELAACDTVGHKSTHVTETVYRHVIVPASRHYSATGSYGH